MFYKVLRSSILFHFRGISHEVQQKKRNVYIEKFIHIVSF